MSLAIRQQSVVMSRITVEVQMPSWRCSRGTIDTLKHSKNIDLICKVAGF